MEQLGCLFCVHSRVAVPTLVLTEYRSSFGFEREAAESLQTHAAPLAQCKPFTAYIPYILTYTRFSQIHNIGNSGIIAICVFPYICIFRLYSNCIVLVNAKLDIGGYKRITFQGEILLWSNKFQISQLKQNWQYWYSCVCSEFVKTSSVLNH